MILIVEDHQDSAQMLARLLKRFGYKPHVVANATDALDALQKLPIRIAILDYDLPEHDGLWLLRQMKADEQTAAVRVIFLSGTFERQVAKEALEAGALEWLVKGVHNATHIMATVGRVYGQTIPA